MLGYKRTRYDAESDKGIIDIVKAAANDLLLLDSTRLDEMGQSPAAEGFIEQVMYGTVHLQYGAVQDRTVCRAGKVGLFGHW